MKWILPWSEPIVDLNLRAFVKRSLLRAGFYICVWEEAQARLAVYKCANHCWLHHSCTAFKVITFTFQPIGNQQLGNLSSFSFSLFSSPMSSLFLKKPPSSHCELNINIVLFIVWLSDEYSPIAISSDTGALDQLCRLTVFSSQIIASLILRLT